MQRTRQPIHDGLVDWKQECKMVQKIALLGKLKVVVKSSLNASKAGSHLGNQGEHMRKRCQRGSWVGRP